MSDVRKASDLLFVVGVVLHSEPSTGNVYVILPQGGPVVARAISPMLGWVTGAKQCNCLLPGTYVYLLNKGGIGAEDVPQWVILGNLERLPIGADMKSIQAGYPEILPHGGTTGKPIATQIFGDAESKYCFNIGRPLDTIPGDWAVAGIYGNGLMVSDHITMLKGSEGAKVEAFMQDDTLRISGERLEVYGPLFEDRAFHYREGMLRIRHEADTLAHFLGVLSQDGKPFTEATDEEAAKLYAAEYGKYKLTAPTGAFYRTTLNGKLVDGEQSFFLKIPTEGELTDKSTKYAGALSESKTIEGNYVLKAAKSVGWRRTAAIVVPREIEQAHEINKTPDAPKEPDSIKKLSSLFGRIGVDEVYAQNSLTKLPTASFLVPTEAEAKTLGEAREDGETDEGYQLRIDGLTDIIPDDEASYLDPEKPTAIENMARTAGIQLTDDGGIVIYGGFGEEIRLAGGNIYITCPGDVITLPGRDSVNMAPRNQIIKADHGTLEVTSNNRVNIAGKHNTSVVSTDGVLLLESKSVEDVDISDFTDVTKINGEKATNSGGVIIKSENRVAMLADRTYIGGTGGSSAIEMVADSLYARMARAAYHMQNEDGFAVMIPSGPTFAIGGTGIFSCGGWDHTGDINILKRINKNRLFIKDVTQQIENRDLTPNIEGRLFVQGSVVANSVSAKGNKPELGSYDEKAFADYTTERGGYQLPSVVVDNTLEEQQPLWWQYTTGGVTPSNLNKLTFSFFSSEGYRATAFTLVESYWQRQLKAAGKGEAWSESVVTQEGKESMSFPGKGRWKESGGVVEADTVTGDSERSVTQSKLTENLIEASKRPDWLT